MVDFPILSLMTFLPLVGAFFIMLVRGAPDVVARNARYAALYTSLFTFALSVFMLMNFNGTSAEFQFVEKHAWLPGLNIGYHMGVDGISVYFVALAAFLTPICILASWHAIEHRVKEYMIAFLVLETWSLS